MGEEVGEGIRKGRIPQRLFLVQPMMIRVCCALIPCLAGAVYFFELRALVLTALVLFFGIATEGAFTLRQGKPMSSAVFVSGLILALSLPPTAPFWIAIIGVVFGVLFGKMVFAGSVITFSIPPWWSPARNCSRKGGFPRS